jgi:hypothetical protein
MKILERFKLADPDTMTIETTIVDPESLTAPYSTGARTLRRYRNWTIAEYVCEENNRNFVDANGSGGVTLDNPGASRKLRGAEGVVNRLTPYDCSVEEAVGGRALGRGGLASRRASEVKACLSLTWRLKPALQASSTPLVACTAIGHSFAVTDRNRRFRVARVSERRPGQRTSKQGRAH